MVTNFNDLDVHHQEASHINPNSPTNDSFWEYNIFMESEHELDPLNTPTTQSYIKPTIDQNANQSEFWMPPEGFNLRFVYVEEGFSGWTNTKIVSMDWELLTPYFATRI